MTTMYKATLVLTGFPGAPGYCNFYATTTDPLQAGLDAFIAGLAAYRNTVKNLFATSQTLDISPEVEMIEDVDGALTGIMSPTTPPAAVTGVQTTGITGVTGVCVTWLTTGAVFGRRRQGRTFWVPVATNAIGTDGTIETATLAAQRTAAANYAAGGSYHPVVWVRRKPVVPATTPPTYVHAGQAVAMSGARITDKAAVLRSRRD